LDLIIGGFGGHQMLPDDASLVQRELGLGESGIRAFTIHATCLSFLVGLEVAGSFMRDGKYQKVAVFASSIASVGIYKEDAHTAGLFGDGAAAIILEPASNGKLNNCVDAPGTGIHGVHMETYGIGADTCRVQGGGTYRVHHRSNYNTRMSYFEMDGPATLALVAKYVPAALHNFIPGLERGLNNLPLPGSDKRVDIDWVVPHQASAVALDSLTMFGWPEGKILKTLHKYGNCIAASIPLTLCDGIDNGVIKRGDRLLLCGTSAGLSCASMLLTY
jgi:3-oxoacyl-[acyl-carrier-protein] synthase III